MKIDITVIAMKPDKNSKMLHPPPILGYEVDYVRESQIPYQEVCDIVQQERGDNFRACGWRQSKGEEQ